MTDGQRPRWPRIVLALVVPILIALALSQWTTPDDSPVVPVDRPATPTAPARPAAPSNPASVAVTRTRATVDDIVRAQASPTVVSRKAQPTPGIFDFASITPRQQVAPPDDERFVPNEHLTQEDLDHPERYFAAAEQASALNKPESRRDTLEFFRAYRDKLERDLAAPTNASRRGEILAIIERYDDAIERLRALIASE